MSHKNAALAFDKLNICQEWMSSSMLKLNTEETESIFFWISCPTHEIRSRPQFYPSVHKFETYFATSLACLKKG